MKKQSVTSKMKKIIRTAIFTIACLIAIALPIVMVESSPATEASAATGTTQATISIRGNGYPEINGTHSSGTYSFTAGEGMDVKYIGSSGFKVTGGNVTVTIGGGFFMVNGPITLEGGTLNIRLPYDSATDSAFEATNVCIKRNEGYSGPLFIVKGGTLNILGGALDNSGKEIAATSKKLTISGAGQFSMTVGSNAADSGIVWPPEQSVTYDDYEASAPIFYIDDQTGSTTVNLTNVNVCNNYNGASASDTSAVRGGGIHVAGNSPTLNLKGCQIQKCYSKESGAALYVDTTTKGKVTMETYKDSKSANCYSRIDYCYTASSSGSTEGGAVCSTGTNKATFALTSTTVQRNWSYHVTGGVFWQSGEATFTNCTFNDNTCYAGGGAIYNKAKMTISGGSTKIQNNKSVTSNGGAIYTAGSGANLTFSGGIISGNTAVAGSGGGVYVTDSASFAMSGGSITDNHAPTKGKCGGGVSVHNKATFTLSSGTISKNTAAHRGGGVEIHGSTFIMSGGTIGGDSEDYANKVIGTTADGDGGVGGGVAVWNSAVSFTMSGGKIKYNEANERGGGVYLADGITMTMNNANAEISYNSSKARYGGGIYVNGGILNMSAGKVSYNEAQGSTEGHGGGIYAILNSAKINISGTAIVEYNTATQNGGGIYITKGSLSITSGSINNNSAGVDGGGVYIIKGDGSSKVTMSGGSIIDNTAPNGAGLYLHTAPMTISGNAKIDSNDAVDAGGGIYSYRGSVTISSGSISNNTASGGGGALVIDTTFNISGTATVSGNTASSESGGGVWMYTSGHAGYGKGATFDMSGGTISGNTARYIGGGLYLDAKSYGGIFKMSGGTISGNTANGTNSHGGGGVHIGTTNGSVCDFQMTGGTVSGNTSKYNGGGIYVNNANFTVNPTAGNILIDGNTATNSGGGIFVNLASLTVSGTTASMIISNNTATNGHAGGIFVEGGNSANQHTFIMNGGKITANHAQKGASGNEGSKGGGVCGNYITFTMNNGDISANTAGREGGAIFIGNGKFVLKNGDIYNNSTPKAKNGYGGGGVYLWKSDMDMENGKIRDNSANGSGGGVSISYADFKMSGGSISGNTANIYGGGVYIAGGDFTMSGADTKLENNYSLSDGGAVYAVTGEDGGVVCEATFTIKSGTISGNGKDKNGAAITERGGAVFVEGGSFTMENGTLSNNAAYKFGGAVYIAPKTISSKDYVGNFTMKNGTISSNRAHLLHEAKGGAFYLYKSNFIMEGGTISENVAAREGGAGYISYGNFTMTAGYIDKNYTEYIGGGALYIWFGSFSMGSGCYMRENHSPSSGGAIYLSFGNVTMTGGEISGNYSGTNGGAVYLRAGEFIMSGGIIKDNYTTATSGNSYGGGVCVAKSSLEESSQKQNDGTTIHYWKHDYVASFKMSGGTITGNGDNKEGTVLTTKGGAVAVLGANFEMSGGTISQNRCKTEGGAVFISYQDVTAQTTTDASGAKIAESPVRYYGDFVMSDDTGNNSGSIIEENYSLGNGGAVYVKGNGQTGNDAEGKFTMSGGTIQYNGKLVVKNQSGDITSETVKTYDGGAVYVANGNFEMSGGKLYKNACTHNGGAVYVDDGNFDLSGDSEISYNTAGNWAGAVAVFGSIRESGGIVVEVTKQAFFTMNGGNIHHNRAHGYSGAIHLQAGTFDMYKGDINDNEAKVEGTEKRAARGGAVGVWYGTFNMHDGALCRNIAESPEVAHSGVGAFAGAVYVTGSSQCRSTFNMYGGEITDNHTHRVGGAVYVGNGDFNMSGGTISGNYTTLLKTYNNEETGLGGAVYVWGGSFTMSGGTLQYNGKLLEKNQNGEIISETVMTYKGGAVYVQGGNFAMTNGTVQYNAAAHHGGAVYVDGGNFDFDNGNIQYNGYITSKDDADNDVITVQTQHGGAVYVNQGNFIMDNGTITGNRANAGGAVLLYGNGETGNSLLGLFEMNDGTISYNKAVDGSGGALYISNGKFVMHNGTVTYNDTAHSGGALYLVSSEFLMNNGEISYNTTQNNGGAVEMKHANFTMNGGSLIHNSGGYGGAVYINGGIFTMDEDPESDVKCLIDSNTATKQGGAVYVKSELTEGQTEREGKFVMNGGTLSNNKSTSTSGRDTDKASFDDGAGAVYVYRGNFEMNGGTISGNTAAHHAGAVYVHGDGKYGTFTMNGGTITGNSADYDGGAVYLREGNFIMESGLVKLNSSVGAGGAVYIEYGNFTMYDGTLSGNNATGNEAGGAVYIIGRGVAESPSEQIGKFEMHGGLIEGNRSISSTAGGVYVSNGLFYMTAGTLTGNECENDGGAVAVGSGIFKMDGGTISNNSAQWGGGVYVNCGSFIMNGTENTSIISGNTAVHKGGGVFVNKTDISKESYFEMNGGLITGNTITGTTSSAGGGGVYVQLGEFNMKGGTISYNTTSKRGGGVFVYGGSFVMSAGVIDHNSSELNGGGVCLTRFFDQTNEEYINGSFQMSGGTISNNGFLVSGEGDEKTETVITGFGGGVYLEYSSFTISGDAIIKGNKCNNQGGGVYVTDGSVSINGGTVTQNISVTFGGGFSIHSNDAETGSGVTMTAGTISENQSIANSGAGVYITAGVFDMSGGSIINNHTDKGGGAIRIDYGGNVIIRGDALISGNSSAAAGGAIYMINGTIDIRGGVISNNVSGTNGGAIRLDGGTCYISGGILSENKAADNGGAIIIDNGAEADGTAIKGKVIMSGGEITGNFALGGHGGGIYLKSGDFTMSGGKITYNEAYLSGGGVGVNGAFVMTGGEMSHNIASKDGGAVYVGSGGSATIGYEGCYGNSPIEGHASCPKFFGNSAVNGGALCLGRSTSVFHCGEIYENKASGNGGAVHVTNANITLNYAMIELNEAASYGGGIYVEATGTKNIAVTVDSGIIRANTSAYGGGIAVQTLDTSKANIIIGRENCDGAEESEHKHPDITANIASLEGGGIWIYTASREGVIFRIYCGELQGNVANKNIPTSNILQEGGQLIISGIYQIDNATVINGAFIRPEISDKTVNIIYHYQTVGDKTTTITAGVGMIINLPSALPTMIDGVQKILVRWETRDSSGNRIQSYECGYAFSLDTSNIGNAEQIDFYAVWIIQGSGFDETPVVTPGAIYNHSSTGSSAAFTELNNGFTMQFAVSNCDPSKFETRFITLNNALPVATTIIMVDITTDGIKGFYYYTVSGDELVINLSDFIKMGSPTERWENSITNANNNSVEEFLFIFDFTRTESAYKGALQVTMTRTYSQAQGEVAPMVQVASCAVLENDMPSLEFTEVPSEIGDSVSFSYKPGIAALKASNLYNMYASLAIMAKEGTLPVESYVKIGEAIYKTNERGAIIIPLGEANVAHSLTLRFIAESLMTSGKGIDLDFKVFMTPDASKPFMTQNVYTEMIALGAKPLPSAEYTLAGGRVYYLGELSEPVAINLESVNLDKFKVKWDCMVLSGNEYVQTNLISVSTDANGNYKLSFANNIAQGTYRITLVVTDKVDESIVHINVPYSFVVMPK